MPRPRLILSDYEPVGKGSARRYINRKTNDVISRRQFMNRATRTNEPPTPTEKTPVVTSTQPTTKTIDVQALKRLRYRHKIDKYNKYIKVFAEKNGMKYHDAKQSPRFKELYRAYMTPEKPAKKGSLRHQALVEFDIIDKDTPYGDSP